MRILLLAPQPFYIDRGTPIAVLLVLRVLSKRVGTRVDVVTYSEGRDVDLPRVNLIRSAHLPGLGGIRPGFSLKKLVCDVLLFFKAWKLVRSNQYDLIHAGEESVFFAIFFKRYYGIPYAYDLDSSMARQLIESKPFLRPLTGMFNRLERHAIQSSLINFPVCNALADLCDSQGSARTVTLHDISQLDISRSRNTGRLREEVGNWETLFLYSGNLESYQGIDLMLEGFSLAAKQVPESALVIIGGKEKHIAHYREKATRLKISRQTYFLGPRPFEELGEYLAEADILVSPRTTGNNTPMKVFPYLHSGKPVLATNLPTHNQILTSQQACLAPPDPGGFSEEMLRLAHDRTLRERLGNGGQAFVEQGHTFRAYRRRLNGAYDWIERQLQQAASDRNPTREPNEQNITQEAK